MDGGAWQAVVHGITRSQTWLSDFTFSFHSCALEKEMATHSSVLAWRIPGMGAPGGLQSMGSHRVGHDWSDLAATAAETRRALGLLNLKATTSKVYRESCFRNISLHLSLVFFLTCQTKHLKMRKKKESIMKPSYLWDTCLCQSSFSRSIAVINQKKHTTCVIYCSNISAG